MISYGVSKQIEAPNDGKEIRSQVSAPPETASCDKDMRMD